MKRLGEVPLGLGLGLVALLCAWMLAASLTGRGGAVLVPQPWQVAAQLGRDGWAFYGPNIWPTAGEALQGFLWGDGLAIALAVLVLLWPACERVAVQLATVSSCIPLIALGPLLTAVLAGRAPMVALSALSVFFTTLVGTLVGLRAAEPLSLELITVHGGGSWQRFRHVQLYASLPALFASLSIAAPSALLGAILGEWLGSVENGLGVAMVIAMQQMSAARLWGIVLVCGTLAGCGYAAIALLGRLLTPWRV